MPLVEIDINRAKQELSRINDLLTEPHLLIGGLAVNQYYVGRRSVDIDLICTYETARSLIQQLYPTNNWRITEPNEDEYRPSFLIKHKHDDNVAEIRFGPKIVERSSYEMVNWDQFRNEAAPFSFQTKKLEKILIPCVEDLAYTKLISACHRVDSNKGQQDFEDFVNLSNHDNFRLNTFISLLERNKATEYISRQLKEVTKKSAKTWEISHIRTLANLFAGRRESVSSIEIDARELYFANRTAFGYQYDEVNLIETIFLDGSSLSVRKYKICSRDTTIRTRDHSYSLQDGANMKNAVIQFRGRATSKTVSHIVRSRERKFLNVMVNFHPSLKAGESAEYEIEMKRQKGYMMTNEEVLEAAANNQLVHWPYESIGFTIKHPIERLCLRVSFPREYVIEYDDSFDVYYGHTFETFQRERRRISEEKCSHVSHSEAGIELTLTVSFPVMGLTYCLRWKPPSKSEYIALLNRE